MFGLTFSYKYLHFLRSAQPAEPVFPGLHRYWLETPRGPLELLAAEPDQAQGPAIVFCHGGMGGAWVWQEYMTYLKSKGVRCYAISLRGHGDSWCPHFLRMVYGTTRTDLESDLVTAVNWVEKHTGDEVVLVGHSSGGGLSQAVLGAGKVQARGLALLGAVPAFGSTGVYLNWARLDPWFSLRMLFHFWHPNSPLSHPRLTYAAFFGPSFPEDRVLAFQHRMSRFESFWWPISMMRPFAKASQILAKVSSRSVLVMAGSEDALMTPDVTRATAAFYRAESKEVQLEFVEGAGHHLQNDVQWTDGAQRLFMWYQTL
ncbi:alpha/beta-hydrolase [Cutaneotrichosporon oleaginosum]|uniref:Alpha/beta-hydrolase n=1 Tax=Cutaneotrichosporon oleaginosum TaxID=879819 RepID=A0A0J1B621_9TREE|nr:alpha/beta-hydrolase [Cutaneotrichosporon oleaginosum]KLT43174.1 alpha/beta-hydrolase [Cutaneotrichosporon oleaginosum]TXT09856.1 hypothetical protein COLE_03790 [Cutaneotrichosporon oleaginosum]